MNPAELFESNLALIDRVVSAVCRRSRVFGADAEDFASVVKLALIERDYDVLRRWSGRASLATYLAVVVQRLLFDQRSQAYGRWHTSREAERLGEAAVMLETLVHRDGRSLDEALPLMQRVDPQLTRERLADMKARLPERAPRPQLVELFPDAQIAASDDAEARVITSDAQRLSDRAQRVICDTLASMTEEDRVIVRLRYAHAMSIADISRMLRLPQRPLYRRLEALLARLRKELIGAGINARDAEELIERGLDWKIGDEDQSISLDGARAREEVR